MYRIRRNNASAHCVSGRHVPRGGATASKNKVTTEAALDRSRQRTTREREEEEGSGTRRGIKRKKKRKVKERERRVDLVKWL